MRLAIVGSREYTNEKRIRIVLEKYISYYQKSLIVVSGGCWQGADAIAKKLAINLNVKYVEFPAFHEQFNNYCLLPPEKYNKPYHVRNFFARNTYIATFAEHLLAFIVEGIKANGTLDTVRKARELGRKVFLFKD